MLRSLYLAKQPPRLSLTRCLSSLCGEKSDRSAATHTSHKRTYSPASMHYEALCALLGRESVKREGEDIDRFTLDWTRTYRGGSLVALPRSTEEVSALLRYCNAEGVAVVPQGGNTGLVGGAVGLHTHTHSNGTTGEKDKDSDGPRDELILSLSRMNRVLSLDTSSPAITAQSGCILETLQNTCLERGFLFPLDLGAKGSCQVGGNVATNAGGLRVLKYGTMAANVLGLEVVLADGTVLDLCNSLIKDNTGYRLKDIFVGSEGTLGVITKVCVRLAVKPKARWVIMAKVPDFSFVPRTLSLSRSLLGDSLSAFEFIDSRSLAAVRVMSPSLLRPLRESDVLPTDCERDAWRVIERAKHSATFQTQSHAQRLSHADSLSPTHTGTQRGLTGEVVLLVEASGTDEQIDGQRVDKFVEALLQEKAEISAIMSTDSAQEQALWAVRETVPVALMQLSREKTSVEWTHTTQQSHSSFEQQPHTEPATSRALFRKLFKYDISLPLDVTPYFIADLQHALQQDKCQEEQQQDTRFLSSHNRFRILGSEDDDKLHFTPSDEDKYSCFLEFCHFGHAGDQNLHLNILAHIVAPRTQHVETSLSPQEYILGAQRAIDRHVFRLVKEYKGSISAEHGIGQQKAHVLPSVKSTAEIEAMRALKTVFDARHILNPGKVLEPF